MGWKFRMLLVVCLFAQCRQVVNLEMKMKGKEGHFDRNWDWVHTPKKVYPTKAQWQHVLANHNYIHDLIDSAEKFAKGRAIAEHCYKVMFSPDSSRYLAFFLHNYDDSGFMEWQYNGMYISKGYRENSKQVRFGAYTLWGMQYNSKWFYCVNELYSFYGDSSINSAQKDFLAYILQRNHYFSVADSTFWRTGGKFNPFVPYDWKTTEKLPEDYKYDTLPYIVSCHKHTEIGILRRLTSELRERDLPGLRSIDPILYDSFHYPHTGMFRTNWARNYLMVPFNHYDTAKNFYYSSMIYDLTTGEKYIWTNKLPANSRDMDSTWHLLNPYGIASSRDETLEDSFWIQYVFARNENGEYLYLKPLPKNLK